MLSDMLCYAMLSDYFIMLCLVLRAKAVNLKPNQEMNQRKKCAGFG